MLYESVFIARQTSLLAKWIPWRTRWNNLSQTMEAAARREYGAAQPCLPDEENRKGHYIMFNLDAPSEAVQEMERNLRLHEDVLRFMTIRLEELRADASPMMHGKGDRDRADRRGRDDEEAEKKKASLNSACRSD